MCFLYLFRKSFGATLVKRVRKAGSDFMNKVPRVSTQVLVHEKFINCVFSCGCLNVVRC